MANQTGALRIRRLSDLPFELHVGTSFHHSYAPHWHDDFFVSAITSGAGRFQFRGTDHLAGRGCVAVIAPGEVHAHLDSPTGRSFRSLQAPWAKIAEYASQFQDRRSWEESRSCLLTDSGSFRSFLGLHRALEASASRLEREALLIEVLGRLLSHARGEDQRHGPVGREREAVRQAREYLHDQYDRDVSLRELASHVRLSPYYFHRAFRQETGMPPHAYQIGVRVLRAKGLLRQRQPISRVASLTGFADQSHLTRHFKRLLGVTPGEYSRQGKNVQDRTPRCP